MRGESRKQVLNQHLSTKTAQSCSTYDISTNHPKVVAKNPDAKIHDLPLKQTKDFFTVASEF